MAFHDCQDGLHFSSGHFPLDFRRYWRCDKTWTSVYVWVLSRTDRDICELSSVIKYLPQTAATGLYHSITDFTKKFVCGTTALVNWVISHIDAYIQPASFTGLLECKYKHFLVFIVVSYLKLNQFKKKKCREKKSHIKNVILTFI